MDYIRQFIFSLFKVYPQNETIDQLYARWAREKAEEERRQRESEAQEQKRRNEEDARRNEEEKRRVEEERRRVEEKKRRVENEERMMQKRRMEEAERERQENATAKQRIEQEKKKLKAKKKQERKKRQRLEQEKQKFEEERRRGEDEEQRREERAAREDRKKEAEQRAKAEQQRIEEQKKHAEEEKRKHEEDMRKRREEMEEEGARLRQQTEEREQEIEMARKEVEQRQQEVDNDRKRIAKEKAEVEMRLEKLLKEGEKAKRELDSERRRETGIRPLLWPSEADLQQAKEKGLVSLDKLGFAVAGTAGSGKSSLINVFLNLQDKHPGAAPVGTTETTTELRRYPDPSDQPPRQWTVWYDVPGAGTLDIPSEEYFIKQYLFVFDLIIVMIDQRVTEIDLDILANCQRFKIPSFIVRSKANQHIRNTMSSKGWDSGSESDEPETLRQQCRDDFVTKTRKNIEDQLKRVGLPSQKVYIVSSSRAFREAYSSFIGASNRKKEEIDRKKSFIDEWELIQDLWVEAKKRRGGKLESASRREAQEQTISRGPPPGPSSQAEIDSFLHAPSTNITGESSCLTHEVQGPSVKPNQEQLAGDPIVEDPETQVYATRVIEPADELRSHAYPKQEDPSSEDKTDKPTAVASQTACTPISGGTERTVNAPDQELGIVPTSGSEGWEHV